MNANSGFADQCDRRFDFNIAGGRYQYRFEPNSTRKPLLPGSLNQVISSRWRSPVKLAVAKRDTALTAILFLKIH